MKYLIVLMINLAFFESFGQIELPQIPKQISVSIEDLASYSPLSSPESKGLSTKIISEQMFSGGCLGNMVRVYEFSNGKESQTFEQYISITDQKAPLFTNAPGNIIIQKDSPLPPVQNPDFSDNSGKALNIEFIEEKSAEMVVRTWIATDSCGNSSRHVQHISFEVQ
ncbi:MAG: hypothetical protein SGI87_11130 [Flavobacteriales bacterium]|nr:hypothetical protein [Flavobacteriales bacterium]